MSNHRRSWGAVEYWKSTRLCPKPSSNHVSHVDVMQGCSCLPPRPETNHRTSSCTATLQRFLNVLNPLKIARHYELNIMHPDERRLIKLLLVGCSPSVTSSQVWDKPFWQPGPKCVLSTRRLNDAIIVGREADAAAWSKRQGLWGRLSTFALLNHTVAFESSVYSSRSREVVRKVHGRAASLKQAAAVYARPIRTHPHALAVPGHLPPGEGRQLAGGPHFGPADHRPLRRPREAGGELLVEIPRHSHVPRAVGLKSA